MEDSNGTQQEEQNPEQTQETEHWETRKEDVK